MIGNLINTQCSSLELLYKQFQNPLNIEKFMGMHIPKFPLSLPDALIKLSELLMRTYLAYLVGQGGGGGGGGF